MDFSRIELSFFSSAFLDKATLLQSSLRGPLFDNTSVQGTVLFGADLSAAQLLNQEQIDEAKGARRGTFATRFPEELRFPQNWPDTWGEGE